MIIIRHTVLIFIPNRKKGKESKIPERQRERVSSSRRIVARRGGIGRNNDRWKDRPFGIKIEGLF
jgi:hypothetical protein